MINPVTPPASTTSGSSSTPLVTIVVRSMARPELGQALASLAAQDYPALEVVVVDATGGAHPPLQDLRWQPRHRVRLVGNGRRLNRAAAANLGLESVTGEYFGYLDDDDTCTPEHVSTLVRAAFAHPEALAVYGHARWLGPDGRLERLHGLPFNRALLYHGPITCWQAALFRSSVIALGCRFRGELDGIEDRDFVAQVADRGDLVMIDAATFCFRPDVGTSGTGVGANFDRGRTARADLRLRTAWFGSGTLHTERAAHLGRRALAQVLAGRTGAARALLERTLVEYPEDPNALHGLARVALATGELERAESLVERAIAVHAGVADFHRTRDEIRDAREGSPFAASDPPPAAASPPGRLAPCPCGSGLRYKACCGRAESTAVPRRSRRPLPPPPGTTTCIEATSRRRSPRSQRLPLSPRNGPRCSPGGQRAPRGRAGSRGSTSPSRRSGCRDPADAQSSRLRSLRRRRSGQIALRCRAPAA
jgi:hypothetical protein